MDEWEYYDAETDGILVKNKEDSTIQLKMVTRRNRPSLIGTTLFGGMEMCRPYWDEMIASMMSENASFEELLEKAEDGDVCGSVRVNLGFKIENFGITSSPNTWPILRCFS